MVAATNSHVAPTVYRQPMTVGDLVQTRDGRWVVEPPPHCPNGHRLGPKQVLVGHTACRGHGGGHLTWTCRACNQTMYGLPLGKHCTVVSGPAEVRISFGGSGSGQPPAMK